MLLEKAWAKIYGGYDKIYGGHMNEGLSALSGAPSKFVSAQDMYFLKTVQF